jgi:hypothetical protein
MVHGTATVTWIGTYLITLNTLPILTSFVLTVLMLTCRLVACGDATMAWPSIPAELLQADCSPYALLCLQTRCMVTQSYDVPFLPCNCRWSVVVLRQSEVETALGGFKAGRVKVGESYDYRGLEQLLRGRLERV